MKRLKRLLATVLSLALMATAYVAPISAVDEPDTYNCQLYGEVTDAGQVISKMVIDYGTGNKVEGVDEDTFTVHSKSVVAIGTNKGNTYYENDRTIVKVVARGQYVDVFFDLNDGCGATLTWLTEGRNYPGELTYTITQNKPVKLVAADGREIDGSYVANYITDNSYIDEETAKFESVVVPNGINYQYYDAKDADSLIVWFHGNGEGDIPEMPTGNNVAQMLGNRGTVAWASDEVQDIYGGADVMAFQAPDTWYYAQNDKLLEKAYNEINEVIKAQNIDPNKVYVSGCSAGGYMTTRMLIAYPDLFAAAMINCPALDVASLRGGETPTDAELAGLKNSKTAIWLVQGETDGSVNTEACSKRMFNIITEGQTLTTTRVEQELNSDFTTYETADGKYKLSIYDTVDKQLFTDSLGEERLKGQLQFAEDYDRDGVATLVQYSDHWSWIFTLNNNPKDAKGVSIMNWAAGFGASQPTVPEKPVDPAKPSVNTGDSVSIGLYAMTTLVGLAGIALLKKRYN